MRDAGQRAILHCQICEQVAAAFGEGAARINLDPPKAPLLLRRIDGPIGRFGRKFAKNTAMSQGPSWPLPQEPVEAECVCGDSPLANSSQKQSLDALEEAAAVSAHSDESTEPQDAQLPSHVARLTRKSVHLIEQARE